MSDKVFIPAKWITHTTWWQRILLWFKRGHWVGIDHAVGKDRCIRFRYKRVGGEIHITEWEEKQ